MTSERLSKIKKYILEHISKHSPEEIKNGLIAGGAEDHEVQKAFEDLSINIPITKDNFSPPKPSPTQTGGITPNNRLLQDARDAVLSMGTNWYVRDKDETTYHFGYKEDDKKASCIGSCLLIIIFLPLGLLYAILGGKRGKKGAVGIRCINDKLEVFGESKYILKVHKKLKSNQNIKKHLIESKSVKTAKNIQTAIVIFWIIFIIWIVAIASSEKPKTNSQPEKQNTAVESTIEKEENNKENKADKLENDKATNTEKSSSDTETKFEKEAEKQEKLVEDNDEYTIPNIPGYKRQGMDMVGEGYMYLNYTPLDKDLEKKILSATVAVDYREEGFDFEGLNETFPIENEEVEVNGAIGRYSYEDSYELDGLVLTKKYETIQMEVVNDENIRFVVQLGHPDNNNPSIYKILYKEEAIKILEALIESYDEYKNLLFKDTFTTESTINYSEWTDCEIIWGKISNADLNDDGEREAHLKELSKSYKCYMRPETVPHQKYPDLDNMPDPE